MEENIPRMSLIPFSCSVEVLVASITLAALSLDITSESLYSPITLMY